MKTFPTYPSHQTYRGILPSILIAAAALFCSVEQIQAQAMDNFFNSPAHAMQAYPLGPETTYELLPQDRGFAYNEEFRKSLNNSVSGSWFRLEYLNWRIKDPKNTVMTEPVPGITNPKHFFVGQDIITNTVFENSIAPDYNDVSLANNQGLRGTFGIPVAGGEVVANVWFLKKNNQLVDYPDVFQPNVPDIDDGITNVIGIGTLLNGNVRAFDPTNNPSLITFNTSFQYRYQTNMMGAEINYLNTPMQQGPGFQLRHLAGVRYIQFNERFDAHGVNIFDGDPGDPNEVTTRNAFWESGTSNDILGPQIGLQAEFVTQYFTVGFSPKFMMGFNRIGYVVKGSQIMRNTENQISLQGNRNQVSPVGELQFYGRIPYSAHLNFFGSYQMNFIGRVSRPNETIRFNVDNSTGVDRPSLFLDKALTDIFTHGATAGFEFVF